MKPLKAFLIVLFAVVGIAIISLAYYHDHQKDSERYTLLAEQYDNQIARIMELKEQYGEVLNSLNEDILSEREKQAGQETQKGIITLINLLYPSIANINKQAADLGYDQFTLDSELKAFLIEIGIEI